MGKILLVFLFLLLLSPVCLAQSSIEVIEGDELHLILKSGNADPHQLKMLLCRNGCTNLEARSVSYNGNEIDIFAEPEEPGFYDLKIFLDGKVYESSVIVAKGQSREPKTSAGITSNIVNNASSPVFFLGILGIFILLFVFFRFENSLKAKALRPLKGEIKFLALFVLSFLVLSPFTHEFFHIMTAGFFNCHAILQSFVPVFTPTSVSFSCEISALQSVIILAAGIAGNLVLGVVFFILARRIKSFLLYSVSLAFFWSSFFYLFYHSGDIYNIMRITGLVLPQIYLDLLGTGLISASFYVFFRQLRK